MSEKINIQDLIGNIAEKHAISRKDADGFVKEFFQLIDESLEKDKYVKIKGLGMFKLIHVDSRESVNVNTGERFLIQGHAKISFTPEPVLKNTINRPFSHFETVALNNDKLLDTTPIETDGEEEEKVIAKEEPPVMPKAAVATEAPAAAKVAATIETPAEPASSEATAAKAEPAAKAEKTDETETPVESAPAASAEPEAAVEKEIAAESAPQEDPEVTAQEEKKQKDSSMKYFIGIIVFVILLCAGALISLYYPDLFRKSEPETPAEKTPDTKEAVQVKEETTLTDDVIAPQISDSTATNIEEEAVATDVETSQQPEAATLSALEEKPQQQAVKEEEAEVEPPVIPDSLGYAIVGTLGTHTISRGETLTKVSKEYYGTKTLWPYLVKHNPDVIKNPDKVPFGTTIKIPKLVKKN